MNVFLNPALLYSILWTFLLFLYNLRLSYVLLPLSQEAFLFFFLSICMFFFGYVLFGIMSKKLVISPTLRLSIYRQWVFSLHTTKVLKILGSILFLGLLAEVIYFKNLPLISLFGIGKPMRYVDFGIHGIHGLFNAIFLVILNILFLKQLFHPTKFRGVLIVLLLSWPVLLMTRQLFVSSMIDFFFLFLLIRRVLMKDVIKIIIFFSIMVFIFGYIGDMRSGRDAFLAIARPTIDYPDYLPSGLLWVYIYMVSPLSNVINNMDTIPYYAPVGTIGGFIPSFGRGYIIGLFESSAPTWELVNSSLNVSSMHQKFLMDYGPFLSNIIYFAISFFSFFVVQRSAKDPRYGLALIVILHGIFFSFFIDFLLNLVFVAQFVLYIICFKRPVIYA